MAEAEGRAPTGSLPNSEFSMESGRAWGKAVLWLVEPHPLAERYLEKLLRGNPRIRVTAHALAPAREPSAEGKPSILLIDTETLPVSLAACLRTARCAFPAAKALAFGRALPAEEICRLLFLGISGYVPYDRIERELGPAVHAVLNGRPWAPREVLERYVTYASAVSKPKLVGRGALTARETAVVGFLQRRLSNKEIGSALGMSERTVRFHLQNIFDKLGVRDRYSVAEITRPAEPAQRGPGGGGTPVRRGR